ncbi:MAG TPA: ATP-binding protein, partial [Candidatus Nitrosotalea sp.]|nr:ATP-binding protein [Candidatus Nitrosotalea sp.]
LWETISNGKIWQGEFKNRSKDGSFYWSKTIIIPHVKNSKITEYVSIGIDVTREKELLVRLDNSQKLATIGELSARVAHDIRNPLSIIKNNFELLQYKDPKFTNKHKDALERIKRAILRITHQVDNVLDYVRPPTLTLKRENLQAITKSALEKVESPDGIKVKYFKKDVFLVCDYLKIEVVLINIITNAIQAMGLKGKLDITCDKHDDNLVMEIRDTGPGIPENILSKIFDPLFTTKQIGTGLGLSSCKSIVEYHGGKISVKSTIGVGTSFIIILPLDLK